MGQADRLLAHLHGARRTGPSTWVALCPAHEDKSPSLSIREVDDGRLLVHCFGQCSVDEVVRAVGLDLSDLFPPRPPAAGGTKPERRRFMPSDVFDILRREAGIVFVVGSDMLHEQSVSDSDFQRLREAVVTIERIAEAAYAR
jgi:hypothetical protein